MAPSSSSNATWRVWFARNDFRLVRFIFAGMLLLAVSYKLAVQVTNTIEKAINNVTLAPLPDPLVAAHRSQGGVSAGEAAQPANSITQNGNAPDQAIAGSAATTSLISLRVWVYGLSLAALTGALAASLWAIVALCRVE